jgi:hypothetical protein
MPAQNWVVTLAADRAGAGRVHDRVPRAAMARRLAALLGYDFAGEYRADATPPGHVYFVPQDTLLAGDAARHGIRSAADLYGGVVPCALAATKAITHALIDDAVRVPPHWPPELGARLREVVLPGYSVFAAADLRRAARRLLAHGRIRIKPARLLGGAGQQVAADADAVDAAIAGLDERELHDHGVVVEQNVEAPRTLSVGEVTVGNVRIAYFGEQRTVVNHHGEEVYGGSDLQVVRGRFDDLLRARLPAPVALAVRQTLVYDRATSATLPGFFASRRNYDVLQGGTDAATLVSGVLEQSWRLGGASPAEIAALAAFRADPALQFVHASTHEVYADGSELPPHAEVYFDGVDRRAGRLRKYSVAFAPDQFTPFGGSRAEALRREARD